MCGMYIVQTNLIVFCIPFRVNNNRVIGNEEDLSILTKTNILVRIYGIACLLWTRAYLGIVTRGRGGGGRDCTKIWGGPSSPPGNVKYFMSNMMEFVCVFAYYRI